MLDQFITEAPLPDRLGPRSDPAEATQGVRDRILRANVAVVIVATENGRVRPDCQGSCVVLIGAAAAAGDILLLVAVHRPEARGRDRRPGGVRGGQGAARGQGAEAARGLRRRVSEDAEGKMCKGTFKNIYSMSGAKFNVWNTYTRRCTYVHNHLELTRLICSKLTVD